MGKNISLTKIKINMKKFFNNLTEQTNNITTFGIIVEMLDNKGRYFKADIADDSDAAFLRDILAKKKGYVDMNRSNIIQKMTSDIEEKIMNLQDMFVSKLMDIEGISKTKAVQLYHGIAYQVLDELGYRYNVEVVNKEVKEVHKQLEKIVYCKKFYPMCGSNKTFIKNTEYRSKKVAKVKEEIKEKIQGKGTN